MIWPNAYVLLKQEKIRRCSYISQIEIVNDFVHFFLIWRSFRFYRQTIDLLIFANIETEL